MTLLSQDSYILYLDSDGTPMAESDPARDYLIYCLESLSIYFQDRQDVYVSGNLFIYYKQGVPDAVVAPDVFVVFGVEKKKRQSYKVWQEGNKVPAFVLEVTSKTTQENDEEEKPKKYQRLGVVEYFQFDPTGDYLQPQLKGSRLSDGQYQAIVPTPLPGGVSLRSTTLDLELHLNAGKLRFYNPRTGQHLLSPAETEQALQETEQALQQEVQARRDAVPRLLRLGLSVEEVAEALSLSLEEARRLANG